MKKLICCFLFILALSSCNNDDNTTLQQENTVENSIKGKWFFYGEEELDENGNVEAFWDLSEKECNSGFIVFKENDLKDEEHANPNEACEKYDYPGTWKYDKSTNILTIIDAEDDYITKGKIITFEDNELRIKLMQQGDDTDFEDWNTHLIFKRKL